MSTDQTNTSGALLGVGNPLLDIIAKVDTDFLTKYGLGADAAILAEEAHMPLYAELKEKYDVTYLAGGACQNSMRGAQRLLPPGSVSYMGCVSDDADAVQLREASARDGLTVEYKVNPALPTGRCATIITGHHRSLVTDLQAANTYDVSHTQSAAAWAIVEKARVYYIEGFFLTVSPPTIMAIAEHAAANNKVFTMNLSAPFLCQFFQGPMDASAPYWDILFGNESEAQAFADAHKLDIPTGDIPAIAAHIASAIPKVNGKRERMVVITQGSSSTVVAIANQKPRVFPVPAVPKEEIEDTNGAGDAFVGGFLAAYVRGESVEKAVDVGHWLAAQVIRETGSFYPAGLPSPF